MIHLAEATNTFGKFPQANVSPVLEIPVDEFQGLLTELAETYNQMIETIRDAGILRGRELAKLKVDHDTAIKATKSPTEKACLISACTRQLIAKIRDGRTAAAVPMLGKQVVQVCTKVMARAIRLVDHVMATVGNDPRKTVALDSQQARLLFSGGGEKVSRKETIRAMRRAEKICPALTCDHRPNDGRQTMRLTATVEGLKDTIPETDNRNCWQRLNASIGLNSHDRDSWQRPGENTDHGTLPRSYIDKIADAVAAKGTEYVSSMTSRKTTQ